MNDAAKWGPRFARTVFDPAARTVKRGFKTVCGFGDVKQVRLREFVNTYEEEQLLGRNPEVQKAPRQAELWLDLKTGGEALIAVAPSAGLILAFAGQGAAQAWVPLVTERKPHGA